MKNKMVTIYNVEMNALLELRKQMEIDFLKTKTYEEINDMFIEMNGKLKIAESEVKKLNQQTAPLLEEIERLKKENERLKGTTQYETVSKDSYDKLKGAFEDLLDDYSAHIGMPPKNYWRQKAGIL